ncbi:hypothetical protein [Shewanella litorisediminis]|uniref:Uncharacterized protein n=1 Tax=Shewanella litorisediminis TaxID=1173586 RepID=A0ABX7G1Y4_9GAMM|nr:hypothetical protein [Shewanella litorisediminis]MCL2918445.1 hypothetical protein [Shewanella litorisediminis]QRH01278.1 hypothetical protein JQC75_15705 [Shewanella litorisediminis]
MFNRTLTAVALMVTLGMANNAQATEFSTTDVLRSVEVSVMNQTKEMLQNAALDLELELKAELTKSWTALTETASAEDDKQKKALVAAKE